MLDSTKNGPQDNSDIQINIPLLRAAKKLNMLLLAGVCGLLGGSLMFVITHLSMSKGLPSPGHYLNLLGVFLPGYSVSPAGAWIGLFWGALIGALLGALVYRVYARSIGKQIEDYLRNGKTDNDRLISIMRIDGNYLGLAMGLIVAGGLVLSTNWLVIRGTAEQSMHASLLVHYLPGYSVSLPGSLIGALELFVFTYAISLLFSWIYNRIVALRHGERS